ncbi:phage portal protein [Planctomicrobium sp. SH668]|uniref:phage portal protein n=1 Tax=Planctomicrobium sp. SH668 TaxID=3448126 RepID=UPI003F5BCA95
MLRFLKDQIATLQLRAKYQRMVHERLLELAESNRNYGDTEEPGNWQIAGPTKNVSTDIGRSTILERSRKLARENPYACNMLRLLESYVTGPGLKLHHEVDEYRLEEPEAKALVKQADKLWEEFLRVNARHYSFREHARRTWRDGECFIQKFSSESWPPTLRFIDPEFIASDSAHPNSQGILTAPGDEEVPVAYLKTHPSHPASFARIPAETILQTRINADSNEKRGVSIFAPVLDSLDDYAKWMQTEMMARKLQSSIVLWRKVQGSAQMVDSPASQASQYSGPGREGKRERFAPGTIVTTNHGTDIQFLQPNTNFGDAVPLGRMLLLSVAAGAGMPEFMLTADASNANFASTMVAEAPAVKYFQSEQGFFSNEFSQLWRWVMNDAITEGLLPEDFFDHVDVRWTFPQLINRDRAQERLADVHLIESGVLSRSEVARRDGVDPETMRSERRMESTSDFIVPPSEART